MPTVSCSIATAIAEQNARLHARDRSLHDLATLPATLTREQVAALVCNRCRRDRTKPLFDEHGQPIASGDARMPCRQRQPRRDPGAAGHALRPGGASRRPAHLPHRAARVHHERRPRHRPLPGKRAVPRRSGRDRAREPRRRTGGSWSARAMRRGSRSATSPQAPSDDGARLHAQGAVPHRDRRQGAHAVHAGRAGCVRAAARHGRARAVAGGLAGGHAGQRPACLHRPT